MTEQYITLETAKLAKQRGFAIPVSTRYWMGEGDPHFQYDCAEFDWNDYDDSSTIYYSAPVKSLLAKWLREEHDLVIVVRKSNDKWHWYIQNALQEGYGLETYEDAMENALQEALKLIK